MQVFQKGPRAYYGIKQQQLGKPYYNEILMLVSTIAI